MLIHYLKTAWRNLLKYKTQNTISILSLAVGVVCFAITLYIMRSIILDIYLSEIDTGIATVNVYKMSEKDFNNRKVVDENFADIQYNDRELIDYNFLKRLHSCEIPSMREHSYYFGNLGVDTKYETRKGGQKILMSHYHYCSPRYFHYNWYRSAITGERIPELKDGDVIITADIRDKVYGKGADPRGLAIYTEPLCTITDVVDTDTHLNDSFSGIFFVGTIPFENYNSREIYIELAPGATAAQLQRELSSAMPEYYFTYIVNDFNWSGEEGAIFVVFVFAVLFLGCSVLLIAVIGFLKMQLQLFSLRSRELALRRTMGARPRQLIMLLAVEIIVVFIFATIVSFAVTALLADYALPVFDRINGGIVFNLDAIYGISLRVILCTLLLTLVISSAVVYRQLHKPVGLRVGRSGHPRTKVQSVMIVVQLAVSMFLILAVLGLFYLINDTYKQESAVLPDDVSLYRRAFITNAVYIDDDDNSTVWGISDFKKRMMQTGTVDHISPAILKPTESPTLDEELLMHYIERKDDERNIYSYEYRYTITDEHIFEKLGIKITSECPENKRDITAVYVPTEDVERLRLKWGLKPSSDTRTKQLSGHRNYTLIGYAKALQHYHYSSIRDYTPAFWIVDENAKIEEGYKLCSFIIFPKRGEYSNCEDAMKKLHREAHPNSANDVPVACLYDQWFTTMRIMEFFGQIALLLVFVSILCIVTSLYSNISLDTRGRQKEIALRKVHGAKSRDIMRLIGNYYVRLLIVTAFFVAAVWLLLTVAIHCFIEAFDFYGWIEIFGYLFAAILIVAFVTLATIGNKIYKVGKINAVEVIKKE